jgi:Flp pilus assembly protein TadG
MMWNVLKEFAWSKSGNFGIMTALLAVPLIGAAGMAIDISSALSTRTALYDAADVAALGAISETSAGVAAAMAMPNDGTVTIAQTDARKLFLGMTSSQLQDVPVSVNISVTKSANVLTSNVAFTATVPTTMMQILGKDSISISGTATAQFQTATFMDFYMLLDNTPSMGVGATTADITTMQNNTSDTCAFACHIVSTTGVEDPNSYYKLAKKLGVKMRIDVVRQATQSLTDTATSNRSSSDQYRMAVYTFGTKAEAAGIFTVSSLTADMSQVKSYTDAVDLMTIPNQGFNNDTQTSFDNALTQMNTTIVGTAGHGTSASDREKVVFFVTDGVADSVKPSGCTKTLTGTRCQEPIDTSFCQPLKDRGVKIAILYTTYLPLPKNGWYNQWISPFQAQIPTRLQSCASPGFYFEVSPTQGIVAAMNALFLKIIRSPRLTG